MALTRQLIQRVGGGVIAVLSIAVLCLYRPAAWAGYMAWVVSRIGYPLFILCAVMLMTGVILVLFSRYRHKSELLAAALAISAALHLLLAATLSIWTLGTEEHPHPAEEVRVELNLGLPSQTEDRMARQMRETLLTPLVQDEKKLETEKPSVAETKIPVVATPAPDLDAPEREPSALETAKVESPDERRIDIEEVSTKTARAEAEAEHEQILKAIRMETAGEPEATVKAETRDFNAKRAERESVEIPSPGARIQTPDLPSPDRVVLVEAPGIELNHAAPLPPKREAQNVKVTPDIVTLEVAAARESTPEEDQREMAAQAGDARSVLAVTAPMMETAEVPLQTVNTPVAPTQAGSATSQAMPQELPHAPRRENPDTPQKVTMTVLPPLSVDVASLLDRAMHIEASPRESETQTAAPSPAPLPEPPRALAPGQARPVLLADVRPEFSERAIHAPDASMAAGKAVSVTQRQRDTPQITETTQTGAPRHTEAGEATPMLAPVPLLKTAAKGAAPNEEIAENSHRDMEAGRVAAGTFSEQAPMLEPTTTGATLKKASLAIANAQTLVDTQARVEYPNTPRTADDVGGGTASTTQSARDNADTLTGLPIRQAQMAAATPTANGTNAVVQTPGPVALAQVQRTGTGAPVTGLSLGRPEAPLAPAQATQETGTGISLAAGQTVPAPQSGGRAPDLEESKASRAAPHAGESAAAAGMMQAGLVAGRVQTAEPRGGDTSAENSQGHRGSGGAGALQGGTLEIARATRSDAMADGTLVANTAQSTPNFRSVKTRESGTLVTGRTSEGPAEASMRGPTEATLSGGTRTAAEAGTMALPLAVFTVKQAPAGDADRSDRSDGSGPSANSPRTVAFGSLAKADLTPRYFTSASAAPLLGWKAPPLPARESGVRLSLDTGSVAGRRVAANLEHAAHTAPPSVQRKMANEIVADATGKKAIYELRSPEKRRFIEELGGSPETEEAVEQALVWLAGAQSDDGHWDIAGFKGVDVCGGGGDRLDGNTAVTGLSLLAYLGAGYTHMAGQHRETVRKALEWLIEGQTANGDLRRGGTMYDQAMATAALCESSSLTGDERLAVPARLAAEFIMNAQNENAGWRYEPRVDNDTSVLGWQILALKSAEISGITVPQRHFTWAGMWLDQVRKGNGGLYSYKPESGPTPVMTAEGWFGQLFMGGDARKQGQQESIAALLENLPEWNRAGRITVHLYYWYYATLALRLSSAPEFDTWNKALKTALLEGHRREGPAAGSWDPDCQLGQRGGRIYSTAMSTLCLEVYYRYLPFYRRMTTEQ